MRQFRWAGLVLCAAMLGTLSAGVIFEDAFNSKDQWVPISGVFSESIENGRYVVENTGAHMGLLKHDMDPVGTFTYTVKFDALTEKYDHIGILFCWDDQAGGYMLTIGAGQEYTLSKWAKSESRYIVSTIDIDYHSFIYSANNTLSVSKTGDKISIACNDVLIGEASDASYAEGIIGLAVGAGEKVAFDHAWLTDAPSIFHPKSYFSDSFEDGDLNGWFAFTPGGLISADQGRLSVNAESGSIIMYVNGDYSGNPVKVIVENVEGSDDAYYGIMLMNVDMTFNGSEYSLTFKGYSFYINGKRQYASYSTEMSSFVPQVSSYVHGTKDTLEVTAEYGFTINGHAMSGAGFDEPLEFNAVALVADSGVSVAFDDFSAGDSSTNVIAWQRGTPRQNSKHYVLGGIGIIYDAMGRQRGELSVSENQEKTLEKLGPGPYYIVPKGEKNYPVKRAVIVR